MISKNKIKLNFPYEEYNFVYLADLSALNTRSFHEAYWLNSATSDNVSVVTF